MAPLLVAGFSALVLWLIFGNAVQRMIINRSLNREFGNFDGIKVTWRDRTSKSPHQYLPVIYVKDYVDPANISTVDDFCKSLPFSAISLEFAGAVLSRVRYYFNEKSKGNARLFIQGSKAQKDQRTGLNLLYVFIDDHVPEGTMLSLDVPKIPCS